MPTDPACRAIVRAYLLTAGLFRLSASLIWAINFLFMLGGGLTHREAFWVNSVFAAFQVCFEIPTGIVADTLGRRRSVLLSMGMLVIGTALYTYSGVAHAGFDAFVVTCFFLALGFCFYSGALEAWLVDALLAQGYTESLDPIFARANATAGWAMLGGTLLGGALAEVHLAAPFVLRVILLLCLLVYTHRTVHDIGFTPQPLPPLAMLSAMRRVGEASLKYGWGHRSVRMMLGMTLILSLGHGWGWHAWQEYFLELWGNGTPRLAGILAAIFSMAAVAGNELMPWIRGRLGRRTTAMLAAVVIYACTTITVGWADAFWISVPVYLVGMVILAIYGTVKQVYLHLIIPSAQRATVISFDSLVGSLGSLIGHGIFGLLATGENYPSLFIATGVILVFAAPFVWRLRSFRDGEDHFKPV